MALNSARTPPAACAAPNRGNDRKKRSGRVAGSRENAAMKRRDIFDLVLLAALWGASFLFTRMAVPAFGALAIAELRVAVAALMLLPLLALRGGLSALRVRPLRFALLGAVNTAIPFALFAWAVLSITAGLAAILNATAPLFTALVAWFWLRERLTALQWVGMAIGFAGVLWLTGARVGFGGGASHWAVAAALVATVSYGLAANVAKRYLSDVRPLAVAAGSQTAAAALLLPFAIASWPDVTPGAARLGCRNRTRRALHRDRLHPVLQADRTGRAGDCGDGDVPDPGLRDAVGRPVPRRNGVRDDAGRLRDHPRRHRTRERAGSSCRSPRAHAARHRNPPAPA